MKTSLSLAALCCFLTTSFAAAADLGTSSGADGSASRPYLIRNISDLKSFAGNSDYWAAGVHVRLEADLDLSSLGTLTEALIAPDSDDGGFGMSNNNGFQGDPYQGIFDGDHHTLSNLAIQSGDGDHVGLFGFVDSSGARVSNLRLTNVSISGDQEVGALVGRIENGTISGCSSAGMVTGYYSVGGLVGEEEGSTINTSGSSTKVEGVGHVGGLLGQSTWSTGTMSGCFATGNVVSTSTDSKHTGGGLIGTNQMTVTRCYATGAVTAEEIAGGLIGRNDGTVSESYATGNVSGGNYGGGFCGSNEGTATNCYATGSAYGYFAAGGFVGTLYWGTTINCYSTGPVSSNYTVGGFAGTARDGTSDVQRNCFWDMTTNGLNTSAGGTGVDHLAMTTLATFTAAGWDFVGESANGTDEIWLMNGGTPKLNWGTPDDDAVDTRLAKLKIKGAKLKGNFRSGKQKYSATAKRKKKVCRVTIKMADSAATAKVNGKRWKPGKSSVKVKLKGKKTRVKIVVSSGDGEKRSYQVIIRRK